MLTRSKKYRKDNKVSILLTQELRVNNYNSDPMLRECGISIAPEFTQVEGRVLQAPQVGTLVEPYCSFHWMSLNAYYAGPLLLAPN